MIIFGTRGVTSSPSAGNFICPQCERSVPYKLKKVTKFFTLYFIPVIPLGSAGEYVECQQCKGTFVPKVLNQEYQSGGKDETMALYEQAIRYSMVKMMLADGEIDDREKEQVLKIINRFGHHDLTMEELNTYILAVQKTEDTLESYLKNIASSLNESGKETIIKCALSVAGADGHFDATEIALVKKMGKILEVPKVTMEEFLSRIPSGSGQRSVDF